MDQQLQQCIGTHSGWMDGCDRCAVQSCDVIVDGGVGCWKPSI